MEREEEKGGKDGRGGKDTENRREREDGAGGEKEGGGIEGEDGIGREKESRDRKVRRIEVGKRRRMGVTEGGVGNK